MFALHIFFKTNFIYTERVVYKKKYPEPEGTSTRQGWVRDFHIFFGKMQT
jgi:hypothetical protein